MKRTVKIHGKSSKIIIIKQGWQNTPGLVTSKALPSEAG